MFPLFSNVYILPHVLNKMASFKNFCERHTQLLNFFTAKYFTLSWKHNSKRWSIFSWNKSGSTYSFCCFFNHFSHNTLLRNQFKSTTSTTHQQLLNQPKKLQRGQNNLPTLNCPHSKLISAQIWHNQIRELGAKHIICLNHCEQAFLRLPT